MLKPIVFIVSAPTHPDLPSQIALLFHRLNVPVQALMMTPIDLGRSRFTIEVFAEPELSDRIEANLANIVYVLSVTHDIRDTQLPPRPQSRRPRRIR